MKIGVFAALASPYADRSVIEALGRTAEERGVDAIWVPEHVVLFDEYSSSYPYSPDGRIPAPPGSGMLEPFTLLSFLAACTTRPRLGTAICLLPQRNPVYTAKEAAAVDYLSDGRFDFGIGVGWLEEEFRVVNVDWPQRGKRTDDYIAVMKALWCDDPSEHHGAFYDLPACNMFPKPVQTPHPPLHFGGESDAALRRVARVGQGWHSFNRLPDQVQAPLATLERMLGAEGRTRADIEVTVSPYFNGLTPTMVDDYAGAGADGVTAMVFATSPDEVRQAFDDLQPCIDAAHALG
jgi:probable F420-dependent oxidoreductase